MSISRSKRFSVVGILFCSLFLMSCNSPSDDVEVVEGIKLNRGSVIENDSGNYSNYNYLNGEYKKVESDEVIASYDHESGSYISQKEGKYIAFHSGKEIELSNIKIGDGGIKLSPGGKYISLYRYVDGIATYKIIKLSDGEYLDFNPKTGISGEFLDWVDDNSLVYYGVNDEGINGIFTYNLKDQEEKLLYRIEDGIVQFLKTRSEGIIIVQESINDKKLLQVIDSKTGKIKTLSDDIIRLYDIVYSNDYYYILGEFKNEVLSIYRLKDGIHERVIFDFPSSIKVSNYGLSLDEEGNILFIGSNSNAKLEEVYKVSQDGTIRKVSQSKKEYAFVK